MQAEGTETDVDVDVDVDGVESDAATAESGDAEPPSTLRMSKHGKRPAEDAPDGELTRPSRPPPAYRLPDDGVGAEEDEQMEVEKIKENSDADEAFFALVRQIRQTEKGRQASDKFVRSYFSRNA